MELLVAGFKAEIYNLFAVFELLHRKSIQ